VTIIKVYRGDDHVDGAFTLQNALKKARSAAGGARKATLVRRGNKLGYKGPYGFVYINEYEAKAIEEQNRANSGGRFTRTP
jgi:hypothetical protein